MVELRAVARNLSSELGCSKLRIIIEAVQGVVVVLMGVIEDKISECSWQVSVVLVSLGVRMGTTEVQAGTRCFKAELGCTLSSTILVGGDYCMEIDSF